MANQDHTTRHVRTFREWALGLAVVGASVLAWVAFSTRQQVAFPEVVVVPDIQSFEPQVTAHLRAIIDAVRSSPGEAATHAKLGLAYEANRIWRAAADCYRNVLALDGTDTPARLHLAICLQELDRHDEALAILRQLAVDDPDCMPAVYRLGDVLLDRDDTSQGIKLFARAVELSPQSTEAHAGLGRAAIVVGDLPRAVEHLRRAVELDPAHRMAHYLLGTALRDQGQLDEAQRELRLGLGAWKQLPPDAWTDDLARHAVNLADQVKQARTLMEAGQLSAAEAILKECLKWSPDSVKTMSNLAAIYVRLGSINEAIELLQRAEQLDEADESVLLNLASCSLRKEQTADALGYTNRAVASAPRSSAARFAKYRVLQKMGQAEDALQALGEAVRLDDTNAEWPLLLANHFLMLNNMAAAKSSYELAIRRDPSRVIPYLGVCEASARLGQWQDARSALDAAEAAVPGHPKVAAARGRLQARTKNP